LIGDAAAEPSGGLDIEVPALILEEPTATTEKQSEELDLANIVQVAAKTLTTVQEAPAIVTVFPGEEIVERGLQTIEEVVDMVPGYLRAAPMYGQFHFPLSRGITQGLLLIQDGISMYDPIFNSPMVGRVRPMETVARVEVVTGPGGVLWGANSFLGVVNVVTKGADDVDGVEAAVTFGDGNGDRGVMRAYTMVGAKNLLSTKGKLFLHTSFETYIGQGLELPWHFYSQPLPNPNSVNLYGPLTRAAPPRSYLFNVDGKLEYGPFTITFGFPWTEQHFPGGFPGFVTKEDRVEDSLVTCSDGSVALPGGCPDGTSEMGLACPVPSPGDPLYSDDCLDPARQARDNRFDWADRYAIGGYTSRFARGKAGVNLKGYFVNFHRPFNHLGILAPSSGLLDGGLAFRARTSAFRGGSIFDADLELARGFRLLYGVEAFHEWLPVTTEASRQGDGAEATMFGPYELSRLPFNCPIQRQLDENGEPTGSTSFVPGCPVTFMFEASRTVIGGYLNPQLRLSKRLVLEVGARLQGAPKELGIVHYDWKPIFSGAAVYGFLPGWHLKATFAQGFRPPVWNNTHSNGEAVSIDGSPDLRLEESQAVQWEINARLFRGKRRLREFDLRMDYSYTELYNYIEINQGTYSNASDRGIHSAEFLGKLHLKGGHWLELGYTWLRVVMAERGMHRALPENWFHLTGVFYLSNAVMAHTDLRVLGAMEDPNRLVEYRTYGWDEYGRSINTATDARDQLSVSPAELVVDRLPPGADLSVGIRYAPWNRFSVRAVAQNVLNSRSYQPDPFSDYEPRLEFVPNPYEDFRFRVSATYAY